MAPSQPPAPSSSISNPFGVLSNTAEDVDMVNAPPPVLTADAATAPPAPKRSKYAHSDDDWSDYEPEAPASYTPMVDRMPERLKLKKAIEGMEKAAEGDCKATFKAVEGLKGGYLLRISLPYAAPGVSFELVKPALGTRVKVCVSIMGGQQLSYKGQVVEDHSADDVGTEKEEEYDFHVQVIGRKRDFGENQHPINLSFIGDQTPANRARNATLGMASIRVERDVGVDIPAVIFRTQPTIPQGNQNAGKDMAQADFDEIVRRSKEIWKLNCRQVEAVKQTFQSGTGLALIYGPPGTGKTTTTTAAAHEHCRIGNTVLYVCPTNKAVDAALRAFRKKQDKNIRAVRFVSGYQSHEKRKEAIAPVKDLGGWEAVANPTMKAAMRSNRGTLFHVRLRGAITDWAAAVPDHPMKEDAKAYLDALAEKKKVQEITRERLTEHFIQNEVDIIFTTCSSACHPTLATYFKPAAAFIVEAGLVTIPDTCMALDSFKETVKWLTMSGDYNQLMPVQTSRTANEAVSVLRNSLFCQLLSDPDKQLPRVMLGEKIGTESNRALKRARNEAKYGKLVVMAKAGRIRTIRVANLP